MHIDEEANGHLNYLPRSSGAHLAGLTAVFPGQTLLKTFTKVISWLSSAHCLIFTSPHPLESRAIDTLKSHPSLPNIYTIGPSTLPITPSPFPHSNWLDSQPPSSVLFVSLGSFLPLSQTQMDEIKAGLHQSGVRFLQAARDVQQASHDELGLVVPWADQLKTLCHPSVGGFLTHCGWNSTLEGIYAGVPMLVLPLMWDQFPNSKLIVDEWKVGLRLKDDGEGVAKIEEIARIVRRLMDLESEEGKEMRRKVKELKEKSRFALGEKGSSFDCIDAFVRSIACENRNGRIKH